MADETGKMTELTKDTLHNSSDMASELEAIRNEIVNNAKQSIAITKELLQIVEQQSGDTDRFEELVKQHEKLIEHTNKLTERESSLQKLRGNV
ncbi:MAG: hypothetical protein LBV26_05930 [Bacteroidales bacterium]|jgi:Zn-dependent M16 (insulinase) family peptidase|nr:hypothetical protein [Bacteroidales bacterium]